MIREDENSLKISSDNLLVELEEFNSSQVTFKRVNNHSTSYRILFKKLGGQTVAILFSPIVLSGRSGAEILMFSLLANPNIDAAYAFFEQAQIVAIVTINFFLTPTRMLIGEENGKIIAAKKRNLNTAELEKNIGRIYQQSFIMAGIISLPFMLASNFSYHPMRWLGQTDGVAHATDDYLRGLSYGIFGNAIIISIREGLNALSLAQLTSAIAIAETICRVGLGFLFTVKGFRLPNLYLPPSVYLVGLTSSFSNTVFAGLALAGLMTIPRFRSYKVLRQLPRKSDLKWLGFIAKHGFNIALQVIFDFINTPMINALAGRTGNQNLLISLGFSNLVQFFPLMLTYITTDVEGSAMSNVKGEGRYLDFRRIFLISALQGQMILLPFTILSNVIPRQIFMAFHSEYVNPEIMPADQLEEILNYLPYFTLILSLTNSVDVLGAQALTGLGSLGDTAAASRINMLTMGLLAISLSLIATFGFETGTIMLLLIGRTLPISLKTLFAVNRLWTLTGMYEDLVPEDQEAPLELSGTYQADNRFALFSTASKKMAQMFGELHVDEPQSEFGNH